MQRLKNTQKSGILEAIRSNVDGEGLIFLAKDSGI